MKPGVFAEADIKLASSGCARASAAIIGTGIYTLTGVGAGIAGPGVILSFAVAGIVCACAALLYAEPATLMPAAGSAYTYTYAVLGEALAWIVGWSLILEYAVGCATVAVGWSGYLGGMLKSVGIVPPIEIMAGPIWVISSICLPWPFPLPLPACWWRAPAKAPR